MDSFSLVFTILVTSSIWLVILGGIGSRLVSRTEQREVQARHEGYDQGLKDERERAARAGAAYWKVNPKTGATEFVYGRPPE